VLVLAGWLAVRRLNMHNAIQISNWKSSDVIHKHLPSKAHKTQESYEMSLSNIR